jgi:hypothetical protein
MSDALLEAELAVVAQFEAMGHRESREPILHLLTGLCFGKSTAFGRIDWGPLVLVKPNAQHLLVSDPALRRRTRVILHPDHLDDQVYLMHAGVTPDEVKHLVFLPPNHVVCDALWALAGRIFMDPGIRHQIVKPVEKQLRDREQERLEYRLRNKTGD